MTKPKNYPFVEPEIAKLAKEKGFKEEYFTWPTDGCPLPLYPQLIDWFREEHGHHVYVDYWNGEFWGRIRDIEIKSELDWELPDHDNYYDALQEVIKKAFELI
jgi:hypothetical protein